MSWACSQIKATSLCARSTVRQWTCSAMSKPWRLSQPAPFRLLFRPSRPLPPSLCHTGPFYGWWPQSFSFHAQHTSPLRDSLSLPTYLQPVSALPVHAAARSLSFGDLHTPSHPSAQVLQPRLKPRFSRSLTGELLDERLEERRTRRQWTSRKAERETSSYARG